MPHHLIFGCGRNSRYRGHGLPVPQARTQVFQYRTVITCRSPASGKPGNRRQPAPRFSPETSIGGVPQETTILLTIA